MRWPISLLGRCRNILASAFAVVIVLEVDAVVVVVVVVVAAAAGDVLKVLSVLVVVSVGTMLSGDVFSGAVEQTDVTDTAIATAVVTEVGCPLLAASAAVTVTVVAPVVFPFAEHTRNTPRRDGTTTSRRTK